jgi:hypothetical protein
MQSFAAPRRPGERRHGFLMPSLMSHPYRRILFGAAFFTFSAAASESNESVAPRFRIEGSGTITMDQPVQQGANMQLRATVAPADAGEVAASNVAQGSRFTVNAILSTASLACYNDTIFRDGFDGTGL